MPMGSLSEKDRRRMAELMRAPLIPQPSPAQSPKPIKWPGPQEALNSLTKRLNAVWSVWSADPVKNHLRARWREWAAGAIALCLVIISVAVKLQSGHSTPSIQLHALDREGRLQIRWDAGSDLIRRATGAKLFIVDGAERLFVKLDGARLRRGAVSYARRSDRVELRMALAEPGGKLVEQQATFVETRRSTPEAPQPEAAVRSVAPPVQAPVPPRPPANGQASEPVEPEIPVEHRARRNPVLQSGVQLPFTCSAGDVFHKTDAPSGWDTFECHGMNVWSLQKNQAREDRSGSKPNPKANTLTAKPASPSTT
jgi:hypothetical protein